VASGFDLQRVQARSGRRREPTVLPPDQGGCRGRGFGGRDVRAGCAQVLGARPGRSMGTASACTLLGPPRRSWDRRVR
jgi:hypothetical protein